LIKTQVQGLFVPQVRWPTTASSSLAACIKVLPALTSTRVENYSLAAAVARTQASHQLNLALLAPLLGVKSASFSTSVQTIAMKCRSRTAMKCRKRLDRRDVGTRM